MPCMNCIPACQTQQAFDGFLGSRRPLAQELSERRGAVAAQVLLEGAEVRVRPKLCIVVQGL